MIEVKGMMSARIERVARMAMSLGQQHLEPYGSYKSRHDFTQRQLMSCLILKSYLKTSYRGLIDWLSGHSGLREILGLEEKLPHYTALQKFSARPGVGEVAEAMVARIGRAALRREGAKATVAIDSTGLEPTGASAYYVSRTGRKCSKFLKVSLSVVCGSILPLGLVLDWGPNNDKQQAFNLLEKSFDAAGEHLPAQLLADAGYDADWLHSVCREVWGVKSWIKPVVQRADGTVGGYFRPKMTAKALKTNGYGRRWHIESFFSGLKRFCGSTIAARLDICQRNEAIFQVLAYALHR
jgi:hypothetical protein